MSTKEQSMGIEKRKKVMIGAMQTTEGREALKAVLCETYPEDVSSRLCAAIDNGSNQTIKKLVKALFVTFRSEDTREAKGNLLLKAVGA